MRLTRQRNFRVGLAANAYTAPEYRQGAGDANRTRIDAGWKPAALPIGHARMEPLSRIELDESSYQEVSLTNSNGRKSRMQHVHRDAADHYRKDDREPCRARDEGQHADDHERRCTAVRLLKHLVVEILVALPCRLVELPPHQNGQRDRHYRGHDQVRSEEGFCHDARYTTVEMIGIEPTTFALPEHCSPVELHPLARNGSAALYARAPHRSGGASGLRTRIFGLRHRRPPGWTIAPIDADCFRRTGAKVGASSAQQSAYVAGHRRIERRRRSDLESNPLAQSVTQATDTLCL